MQDFCNMCNSTRYLENNLTVGFARSANIEIDNNKIRNRNIDV
jgi:hypothetical protein